MPHSAMQGFARVRACFHQLIEMAPAERVEVMRLFRVESPALADDVQALLDGMHPADLDSTSGTVPETEQIPGYRMLRRIGSGGMGEVWEAERATGTTRQRVAIKLLHGGRAAGEIRERFLREHRILAKLSHPHIAAFIDAGIAESGRAWLAMEFVEGVALNAWCTDQPKIEQRVQLFLQICAAVHYAHLHLVVHRDIKPANIMVSAHAGAKLLDFGIAKLLDDSEADLTATGMQAMTARYAAPEQVGGGVISVGTDVYSLGILLFEMLAGCSPYALASAGTQSYATSVIGEDMRALTPLLSTQLSRRRIHELELILRRALAKSVTERYSSVAALADDVRDWLAQMPMRSGIGGGRARLRHLLRAYRWPLLAVGAVMLAISIGALLALQQAHRAELEKLRAEQHMAALLDVIGSANSGVYAGRDPLASDLLITAADRLIRDAADDPELLRSALSEIGHGLLNLGRTADAERILQSAVKAMDREGDATPKQALGLLKLLALTQDTPASEVGLRATAARIELMSNDAKAPSGLAIDALASAAGSLSRIGAFEDATRFFAVADELWRRHPEARASERENYLRQRGWAALRAVDFSAAYWAFDESLRVMDSEPGEFASLRRAEAQWLLAEAALGFDPALAVAPMQAARATVLAHYPQENPEHAQWLLLEALAATVAGQYATAAGLLDTAEPILRTAPGAVHAREMIVLLRAWADAEQDRCVAAAATLQPNALALQATDSARVRYWLGRAQAVYLRDCRPAE